MSHVILHPIHGSEDHRIFIPRNRHHITDAKYDVTGRDLNSRKDSNIFDELYLQLKRPLTKNTINGKI